MCDRATVVATVAGMQAMERKPYNLQLIELELRQSRYRHHYHCHCRRTNNRMRWLVGLLAGRDEAMAGAVHRNAM